MNHSMKLYIKKKKKTWSIKLWIEAMIGGDASELLSHKIQ